MKRERGRAPARPAARSKSAEPGPERADETRMILGHLAAAMAHEVRNPLNSIALHAELLEGKLRRLEQAERDAALRSLAALQGEVQRVDEILAHYLRYVGPTEGER